MDEERKGNGSVGGCITLAAMALVCVQSRRDERNGTRRPRWLLFELTKSPLTSHRASASSSQPHSNLPRGGDDGSGGGGATPPLPQPHQSFVTQSLNPPPLPPVYSLHRVVARRQKIDQTGNAAGPETRLLGWSERQSERERETGGRTWRSGGGREWSDSGTYQLGLAHAQSSGNK